LGFMKKKLNIALLTNRGSDNVGDQIIEACDISLITCAMRNLGYEDSDFAVKSYSTEIISKRFLATGEKKHIKKTDRIVKGADIVVFGGAPMFNHVYQQLYRKTIIVLDIAERHGVPVVFSAIGIENYDEANEKCQELKRALNRPCVKQVTTRDDFGALGSLIDRDSIAIAKVADPAVFSFKVFERFLEKESFGPKPDKPVIGLFPIRGGAFSSNGVDFTGYRQLKFWENMAASLEKDGFDYRLMSTGHFSDEVFLELLRNKSRIDSGKFVFNVNCPEKLIAAISSFHGLVAYRLHANITAYSLGVPGIGLAWNQKVPFFYDSIGKPHRAFSSTDWTAKAVKPALLEAIEGGVELDEGFCMTVYASLFEALKKVFKPDAAIDPYGYQELMALLPAYKGTSTIEQVKKNLRKTARIHINSHKYTGESAGYLATVRGYIALSQSLSKTQR